MHTNNKEVRLDVWLWSVRIYKTRSLAAKEIKAGRVEVNNARKKPSSNLSIGDTVNVRKPPYEFELIVDDIIEKRVSAAIAQNCYHESTDSIGKREKLRETIKLNSASFSHTKGRPTKRNRRNLNKLKWNNGEH